MVGECMKSFKQYITEGMGSGGPQFPPRTIDGRRGRTPKLNPDGTVDKYDQPRDPVGWPPYGPDCDPPCWYKAWSQELSGWIIRMKVDLGGGHIMNLTYLVHWDNGQWVYVPYAGMIPPWPYEHLGPHLRNPKPEFPWEPYHPIGIWGEHYIS